MLGIVIPSMITLALYFISAPFLSDNPNELLKKSRFEIALFSKLSFVKALCL